MAGIYFHIPWCRKVCIYCDFHFTVSMKNKDALIKCMLSEMELQRNYTGNEKIKTLYFGGGTPSILDPGEIRQIIDRAATLFPVSEIPEITLEANPDDMSASYSAELRDAGINRLSIGVQSFFDDDLQWMNRRHDSAMSVRSVENSIAAGFENISIDLIYGLPGMDACKWRKNLEIAFKSGIQHLSAYHLTLEDKTVYAHRVKKGLLPEPDEVQGIKHYEMLMDMAAEYGFIHYEISNFCKPGFMSRHNTAYWLQETYLGIGPSANSYNRSSRQWNVRNNSKYIEEISRGVVPFTSEILTTTDLYNEYLLTSLRTQWGADTERIAHEFGSKYYDHFMAESLIFLNEGKMERKGTCFVISRKGKFFADGIISGLFYTV
jgi:oxygen-independent coproporphyrinogen III oxidase